MDVLGSHEWNFECSKSPSWDGELFNLLDAFRISAGVSTKVPHALRNLACESRIYSIKTQCFDRFRNLR